MRIIVDYESFFEQKYGYRIHFAKAVPKVPRITPMQTGVTSFQTDHPSSRPKDDGRPPPVARRKTPKKEAPKDDGLSVSAVAISTAAKPKSKPDDRPPDEKPPDPVPPQLRADFGDLASVIARDIFSAQTGVAWSDIVGLDDCKRILREAVVMPLKFPNLFKKRRLLKPWRGVLLHGPPGTGKTLLAKAVAGEGTTFFNISASTIVSKWRGDSEKLVRVLFELARHHAPSTIFLDELDSVMSRRSTQDEHEASRRLKTELLVQMDGLVQSDALVFVLAASNFPFDLDPALLRRLEKRILVPLPERDAREGLFRQFLTPDICEQIGFGEMAARTSGYSGSDIHLICKEAAMEPLRRLMANLQEKYGEGYLDMAKESEIVLGMITQEDVEIAFRRTKASEVYNPKVYEAWQEKFGVV
jgi:katanin p60 ATPase-containing subunit A1